MTGKRDTNRGRELDGHAARPRSAAVRLLRKVIANGWFPADAVARALVISNTSLDAYLAESKPMPLDRQLCLALFVIECIPPLARAGQQLRAQVAAAIAYQNGVTETHAHAPPSRLWPSG